MAKITPPKNLMEYEPSPADSLYTPPGPSPQDQANAPVVKSVDQASAQSTAIAESNKQLMPTAQPTTATGPKPEPVTTSVQENETVSGQLKQLLSADSPYLEQGREEGRKFAASRGLQNTSLAVQSGEQARIAAALPVAQQDASVYAGRAELNQNTKNQFRMAEVDHLNRVIEMAQQGDINSRLQLEQFGFNSQLSAQENLEQMERMAFAGDLEARQRYLDFTYTSLINEQQQGFSIQLEDQRFQNSQRLLTQEFQNALGLSDRQSQLEIERLNQQHRNTLQEINARAEASTDEREADLTLQLQANYLGQVAARQQATSEEIRLIMQTEGLTSAQQQNAVSQAQRRMQDDIGLLGSYYAKSPQWDDSFSLPRTTNPAGPNPRPASPPLPTPRIPYATGGGAGGRTNSRLLMR